MKKRIASTLIFAMLLSVAAVTAGTGKDAQAASKPTESWDGLKDIYDGLAETIVGEKGKTVTVTFKNVKKDNVKDIKVFSDDTDLAAVTKIITGKKVGYQIKVKKIGETKIDAHLILKKKQGGKTVWNFTRDFVGVKKLSKSELASVDEKYNKVNQQSALLEKHKMYAILDIFYSEKGEFAGEVDAYRAKDDVYFVSDYVSEQGRERTNCYYKPHTGYFSSTVSDGSYITGFVFDTTDVYMQYMESALVKDEKGMEGYKIDKEWCYTSGINYYYYSEGTADDTWFAERGILDSATTEMKELDAYIKTEAGKVYKYAHRTIYTDVEMPDMYDVLKAQYERKSSKTRTVTYIYDPGTADERKISLEIPQGVKDYNWGIPEGYSAFFDAAGTQPATMVQDGSDGDNDSHLFEDETIYFIKTPAA